MHSFKRTLGKALAFLLAVLLVTALITEPYFQSEAYLYQDDAVRGQMAGELNMLICGSSHAYYGIAPAVVDEKFGVNSYNLSAPMMTMAGRYELLKKELERNPVELVILDASFSTFNRNREAEGPEGDIYQLGRYRNVFERAGYFLRHIRLGEYGRVYADSLERGLGAIHKLLQGEGQTGSSTHYVDKGWIRGESIPQYLTPPENYHTEDVDTAIDAGCKAYMDQMIALCQERDIPVLIVVTPISQSSTLRLKNLDVIRAYWIDYCREKNVPYFDFNLYKGKTVLFPNDTAYYDGSHLAEDAAWQFTGLMCDTLLQWQAGADVSGLFYTSYAEAEAAALSGCDLPLP